MPLSCAIPLVKFLVIQVSSTCIFNSCPLAY